MQRILLLLLVSSLSRLVAQVPFGTTPSWISTEPQNYSTGCAWADLNNDGWLDLVIANGNDMARERLAVYYNTNGVLPTTPSWQSSDIDYHGHLAVGDVNGDRYADVAVSVYIGAAGFSQKGKVKLYLNSNGTLGSLPSWMSRDSMYTFSCSLGDADGDGDLDLAVASGEAYYNRAEQSRIYYNTNGRLDSLPRWKSQTASYSYDVAWADFDNDGDLDLIFGNERAPNRLYTNYGDSIATMPAWSSADASQQANSLFVGDVNNDGWLDLAISDNNQLGGTGRFKLYRNTRGRLDSIPFWTSAWSGYGSGICLADIDHDGDRDLLTGGWWQPLRIYTNQGGSFTAAPQWTSSTGSVVEAIVCGDYDNDGLDTLDLQFTSDGRKKLYYVPRAPIQRLLRVTWNGDPDSVAPYCADLENGWLSFRTPAGLNTRIDIRVLVSHDLDMAVSNWDSNIGNYIFRNTFTVTVPTPESLPTECVLYQNFPNPFNPTTTILYAIPVGTRHAVSLRVFDVLGREVATLVNEVQDAGFKSVTFDASNLASGVYLYRLQAGSYVSVMKMMVMK
jgi:hypothetical protein